MINLKVEVDRFCEWMDSTTHDSAEWETSYPDWPSLLEASETALASSRMSSETICLLLYVLSRDNECERVKEMLAQYPRNGMKLAFTARAYPEMEARWQIADFLGTQKKSMSQKYLWAYFDDPDEYVRRRALGAMVKVDPKTAEAMAFSILDSSDEYSRLVGIRTLAALGAKETKKALVKLESDPSSLVLNAVNEIAEAV